MVAVIAAMNQSIAVYEMSPSATAVESQLIKWMCSLVGFGAGSGGTFTSGGTEATLTALPTAGSTPTGAFDDLDSIGRVCEARGIWLHVDGARASALFSAKHRDRLRGLHRARSLAWDPRKKMLMPLQVGMLLVGDERDRPTGRVRTAGTIPVSYCRLGGEGRATYSASGTWLRAIEAKPSSTISMRR